MKNNFFDYFIVLLKGLAMGAADVVPGVSGGTIAFITGIYERWINALSSINLEAFKKLFKEGFVAAWQHVDGTFMLSLFTGIAISVVSLAKVIKWLMVNEPIMLWSFFFGLVVASVVILLRQIGSLTTKNTALLLLGAVVAAGISLMPTAQTGELNYLFLFFAGALAICAMILPGVSGSFILVLMGAYEMFLDAINSLNLLAIGSFGAGAAIGLLSFARLLKWLFARYRTATLSLMTGFVAGSLLKIWPWKHTTNEAYPSLPSFGSTADNLSMALLAMLVGFVVVMSMEVVSRKLGH